MMEPGLTQTQLQRVRYVTESVTQLGSQFNSLLVYIYMIIIFVSAVYNWATLLVGFALALWIWSANPVASLFHYVFGEVYEKTISPFSIFSMVINSAIFMVFVLSVPLHDLSFMALYAQVFLTVGIVVTWRRSATDKIWLYYLAASLVFSLVLVGILLTYNGGQSRSQLMITVVMTELFLLAVWDLGLFLTTFRQINLIPSAITPEDNIPLEVVQTFLVALSACQIADDRYLQTLTHLNRNNFIEVLNRLSDNGLIQFQLVDRWNRKRPKILTSLTQTGQVTAETLKTQQLTLSPI